MLWNKENTEMNSKIEKAITNLEKSPLFALTLCGKELAHSNFWAWLINLPDNNGSHPFIDAFIPNFNKTYQFEEVTREEGNRDLTIYCRENGKGKCFIIENKLKAIPTVDQLEKYVKKFNKKGYSFERGILTGIEDTLKSKKPKEWGYLSYSDISKSIKSINKKRTDKSHHSVIEDYCKDLDSIVTILCLQCAENQNKYVWDVPQGIKEIRMADIYLKMEGENFGKYLRAKIADTPKLWSKKWGKPIVKVSFNNSKSTISIIYIDNDHSEEDEDGKGRLGIQIEGREFRYYGGPAYPKSPLMKGFPTTRKDRDNSDILKKTKLFKEFCACGWFLPYDPQDKKYRGEETTMTKLFLAYKTNEYCHAYQYYLIDAKNPDNTTYDALWDKILNALSEAKKIIDKGLITF